MTNIARGIDFDIYKPVEWGHTDSDIYYEHVEDIDGFNILFQAVPEIDPELGDMEDADKERIIAEIEAGTLVEFCAVVTCSQLGQLLDEQSLGSCIYKSYEEFTTTYRDDYYMSMVNEAISNARARIHSLNGDTPW